MKVEILIFAYLAVCTAMIIFNIVCIFVFRKRDKNIEKRSINFNGLAEEQMKKEEIDENHKRFLKKKLKKINHMMAFDEALEKLYSDDPEGVRKYIDGLSPVFVFLTGKYSKKNNVQAAYFPYIIKKYDVFKGMELEAVNEQLFELVKDPNLYCRENALQALYSIGDTECVIFALKILDRTAYFHHSKMIADGLLAFGGDRELFDRRLWEEFDKFSIALKQPILDYFRFSSGDHCEKMLDILTDLNEDNELRFSAIRYFAKYRYEPAIPVLYELSEDASPVWEYKAIAASALGNYPSEKTERVLKSLLTDRNWYVRYNASESLDRLGVRYEDLIDVFEGKDRYASEMLRYRFDRKKLKKKEASVI